ncbi:hypothetical protein [Pseudanabaena sp. SR411]|uniref:hypothetical protein n=1 Tax=Pseudanabaena sp. SR411 TaxID=1980935 RepID=UPI0015955D63|nr:hypothetical protein [Pseudanabaena sp. SR411]
MELLGLNSDLSVGSAQSLLLSTASLQVNITPNFYGLSAQSNSHSQIASIQFDATTGWRSQATLITTSSNKR